MKYLEKLFNEIETTADNDLEIEIVNYPLSKANGLPASSSS